MSKDEPRTTKEVPYGWCITGQHDSPAGRGECPVRVGAQGACPCPCHEGATEPRGFISGKGEGTPAERVMASEEIEAERGGDQVSEPVTAGLGEQLPLL